jgi:maltose/moltooligosaccharide transporter
MEPYRAYVGDRLDAAQRPFGFLTQSAFTGLAQTLAYLAPSMLVVFGVSRDAVDANHIPAVTRIAFVTGSVLSVVTVLWSVLGVPELPLGAAQIAAMRRQPVSWTAIVRDIRDAVVEMPVPMRQLALAMLFQWYAMFCYWQYIAFAIGRSLFHASTAGGGFRDAVLISGQIGGAYNFVAFFAAFAMAPFARRLGVGRVHAACLTASGLAMLALPGITDRAWLFAPMLGIGVGWASMMGNPYVMLADCIPPARTGIYMGIFNMFIVIPMLIEGLTLPLIYHPLLGGDPRLVLTLAGGLMLAAAGATLLVRAPRPAATPAPAILA